MADKENTIASFAKEHLPRVTIFEDIVERTPEKSKKIEFSFDCK